MRARPLDVAYLHVQMKIERKNQAFLICFVVFFSLIGSSFGAQLINKRDNVEEIDVGVILDMGSMEGKMVESCISMAISDFYSAHSYYKTRVVLHTRDSKGKPLLALSSALDLLENNRVRVFIGAQTSMEAKFLAELGDQTKVLVISFSPFLNNYPFFIQITQDETSQATAIAAIGESFKWMDVIIIQEDNENWRDFIPNMVDSLQEKNIHIAYKSTLASSSTDSIIIHELHKFMTLQQTTIIMHLSPFLASRVFMGAKKLGMMSKGYAWILTTNSMNQLESFISNDMLQGVIGLKSYIPHSKKLQNFTSRWRKKFLAKTNVEVKGLSAICLWAYDVTWGLAESAENTRPNNVLLKEILKLKFNGLSGEFELVNGKLVSNAFEIVNVSGKGDRKVGFWSSSFGIIFTRKLYSSNHGRKLSSTTAIPNGKKLRVVVTPKQGFPELVNTDFDNRIVTGFCVDVFTAAIGELEHEVDYEFIIEKPSEQNSTTYNELAYQVYLQKYDAIVGDITITSNRSLYVDFTLPYTDLGVGMVAAKDSEDYNIWIFMKPLTTDLWLSTAAFFIFIGIVIWLIERPINNEFQGSLSQQIGMIFWYSFSTLVFAHREKLLSNYSRFVVIVWVFVVLILTSSYTATLSSMFTVQQIQLNSKDNYYIGYQSGSFTKGVATSNLNFKSSDLKPFNSPEEYANALSKGSKKGGVSAIIDEIPYIKIFLARYPTDYSMITSMSTTNGFAFAFHKGSPLVQEMSRAIARLRENEMLKKMEDEWFRSQSTFTYEDTVDSNNVQPLNLYRFRGLFLVSGLSSALALAMLYTLAVYGKYWDVVRNCNLGDLVWGRLKFFKEYISKKIFK